MDGFLRCRSPAPRATASDPPTRPWRRSAHRPGRIPVWNRGHRLGQYYCPKSPCQILPRNTRVAMPCQCEFPAICFLAPGWEARRGPRPLSRRNVIALDARPGQWEFRPGPTGLRRILVITPAIAYGLDTCADKRRDRGCRSSGRDGRHRNARWRDQAHREPFDRRARSAYRRGTCRGFGRWSAGPGRPQCHRAQVVGGGRCRPNRHSGRRSVDGTQQRKSPEADPLSQPSR